MPRILICFAMVAIVAGCANTPGDRSWYEGLRMESARRQNEPGRDLSRDSPAPSFDTYEQERRRLKEGSNP